MAWTAPRTWTVGEIVTAALLNTHLRDNLLETAPAKVGATGDMLYSNGNNSITRLAIGSSGKHLVSVSGIPAWKTTPSFRVRQTSSMTLTSGAFTAVNFNDKEYDPEGMNSTVTNSSRVTINTPGVWSVGGAIAFDANSSGDRFVSVLQNGSTNVVVSGYAPALGANPTYGFIHTEVSMSTGEYFVMNCRQTSGGNLGTIAARYSMIFWGHWIGPTA